MNHGICRASFAAVACALAFSATAQITTVKVTGGTAEGVTAANGIASFKGLPFAAPPTGERRWKKPQPPIAWQGVKHATDFGPSCMQDAAMLQFMQSPPSMSEDCLYLNVWTPAKSDRERLPVMVWIYGGGFAAGATSSPTYDGAPLAAKGVVLVSVAYRVGAFGFLAHPELSRESGKGSGNYGLQDMVAGLQWVRDNIAAARTLPADKVQAGQGPGLGGGFWPVDDGDVLPGDQYVLYSQGHFNDTPVLIGTNSDEGALFIRAGVR